MDTQAAAIKLYASWAHLGKEEPTRNSLPLHYWHQRQEPS